MRLIDYIITRIFGNIPESPYGSIYREPIKRRQNEVKVEYVQDGPVSTLIVKTNPSDSTPLHFHLYPQEADNRPSAHLDTYHERVIHRLDHIVNLLTETFKIHKLLLQAERKEIKMAHEVRDAIQELVITTTAQTIRAASRSRR